MSNIVNVIAIILFLLCWTLIIKKVIVSKYAPVKTVKAEVFDKFKSSTASQYPGVLKKDPYVVVFTTKKGKLSFVVSEFSYQNYKIKDKGTLKYKGSKIISFQ